jgi:photosystem II stability/assembly factor-like uncharacterized protein
MSAMIALVLPLALTAILPGGWQDAPCWVADAAARGDRVLLLCDQQRIFRSDGGEPWREFRLPSGSRLRAIAALSRDRVFIAGDDATLLSSSDGGASWRAVPVPTTEHLRSIHFAGPKGWIAGWGGVILHSADNGEHWTAQTSGTTVSLESVFFADEKHGWCAGWNGAILRTEDGGEHWTIVSSAAATWSLNAIYFRDPLNGWAVGILGQVIRSRDGGKTWEKIDTGSRRAFQSISFDASGRGWISGGDQVLVSADGGESWTAQELGVRRFVERFLATTDSLWAVGPSGMLRIEKFSVGGPPQT